MYKASELKHFLLSLPVLNVCDLNIPMQGINRRSQEEKVPCLDHANKIQKQNQKWAVAFPIHSRPFLICTVKMVV